MYSCAVQRSGLRSEAFRGFGLPMPLTAALVASYLGGEALSYWTSAVGEGCNGYIKSNSQEGHTSSF